MSNIDRYTQFIAEQISKGQVVGLRSTPVVEKKEVEEETISDTDEEE